MLLIETCQDLLQAKIATIGVLEAMRKAGKRLPVQVQVTLQESGTMLLGTEIGAALTALEPFEVDAIGTELRDRPEGDERRGPLSRAEFDQGSFRAAECRPAAERRRSRGVQAVAAGLAEYHKHFVKDYGVRIVGGCCGTRPNI